MPAAPRVAWRAAGRGRVTDTRARDRAIDRRDDPTRAENDRAGPTSARARRHRPWRRLGSGLQAGRAPRAAAEALTVRRERADPQRAVMGARRLPHPELDTLGPDAIAAPALGARDVVAAPGLLLDLGEKRCARFDRPDLIARRCRGARVARARIPVGVGVRVGR